MSSASWVLQQAIYAALSADSTLCGLIGSPPRLYDAVPRSVVFPYLVLAEDVETAWDSASDSGSLHKVVLHAFSRGSGRKEIKLITVALCAALPASALTLSGHHLVNWSFTEADFRRESDGRTYRATVTFRAVTEPTF